MDMARTLATLAALYLVKSAVTLVATLSGADLGAVAASKVTMESPRSAPRQWETPMALRVDMEDTLATLAALYLVKSALTVVVKLLRC